eukprot:1159684-Pelagomonas_calceolata.AAC.6
MACVGSLLSLAKALLICKGAAGAHLKLQRILGHKKPQWPASNAPCQPVQGGSEYSTGPAGQQTEGAVTERGKAACSAILAAAFEASIFDKKAKKLIVTHAFQVFPKAGHRQAWQIQN